VPTDAERYQWFIQNYTETCYDSDGEEISYFLHFGDTLQFESVESAIDRLMTAERDRIQLEVDKEKVRKWLVEDREIYFEDGEGSK